MSNKLLVQCPTCEINGKRQVLGELKDGHLVIMRFHNGFTKIRGEFEVVCSICDEPVYFKTERRLDGQVSDNRESWVSGSTLYPYSNQDGTLGTLSA